MSGAQLAHWLKTIGNGSEMAGIYAVYRAGWLVCATQTLAVYGAYRLVKWGCGKLRDSLHEYRYIEAEEGDMT